MKILQKIKPVRSLLLEDGTRFYDFGKHAFATLEIHLTSRSSHDIEMGVGEVLDHGRLNTDPGESRIYQSQTAAVHPGENTICMEMHHPGYTSGTLKISPNVVPFRYAEIKGCNDDEIEVLQNAYFGAFDDDAADFKSSSPVLDRIWEFCKYTMKATTPFEIFIDGNRERQAYEGDTYINQLGYLTCTSNPEIPRNTIERLFAYPTWPTEWQLSMIPIVHDYLLYTGDRENTEKWYLPLQEKLMLNSNDADNLLNVTDFPPQIVCPGLMKATKIRDIVDWPEEARDDHEFAHVNLVPNCWQYMALCRMAELAEQLGHHADALRFQELARNKKTAIRNKMLKNGLFVDHPGSTHTSLHSSIFSLLWDIADDAEKPGIRKHLRSRGMACSVFGAQFLLECCYRNRMADYALQLMTDDQLHSWNNMMAQGATITMEAWDNSCKPNQDWNHPWGAAPGNIIVRYLAGIRPVAPGYERFTVDPQPGSLTEFHLRTPVPQGEIRLDYQNGTYTLTVPRGTQAVSNGKILPAGVHQWQNTSN